MSSACLAAAKSCHGTSSQCCYISSIISYEQTKFAIIKFQLYFCFAFDRSTFPNFVTVGEINFRFRLWIVVKEKKKNQSNIYRDIKRILQWCYLTSFTERAFSQTYNVKILCILIQVQLSIRWLYCCSILYIVIIKCAVYFLRYNDLTYIFYFIYYVTLVLSYVLFMVYHLFSMI